MALPKLPARAAYLHLSNPSRRNALSLNVLRSLKEQLLKYNTSPSGRPLLLPSFSPELLSEIEKGGSEWLADAQAWKRERKGLPNCLVLRSEGPVFSSGHDLVELRSLDKKEVKETFDLCGEVMRLIRMSPVPVVGVIQGLATAAGAQLALMTDFPIALASTPFRLPGTSIGLPCISPSTIVSFHLPPGQAYRIMVLGEPSRADQLNGVVDVVKEPDIFQTRPDVATEADKQDAQAALEARVAQVVTQLTENTAGQPAALGKWAYWTQLQLGVAGMPTEWTARVMTLLARSEDAKEGITAFLEKRRPAWKT